ncbi:hypothetical protein [Mycolicibacterium mengxianglii]|uniref:hypothetical protein n=1 Tax=Mycolicibacterium mengxianglii TaxID=2736649 RepID=UPI0018EEF0A2|nr:hypothetical protein [Mycolicibacterium mengxianglii]
MAGGHKHSGAKQARREARRRKARRRETVVQETPDEAPLIDEVREALDGGQPLDLLGLVSMLIVAATPQRFAALQPPEEERLPSLDELVAAFTEMESPETTALLAALGELLVNEDVLRAQCRRAAQQRHDSLPGWLGDLAQTRVYRAVRMTHVLGDGDELLLGVRLADGQEFTCAAYIDHLWMSEVKDAFFVPDSIDAVLALATASNDDPDTSFAEVDPADARAGLQQALDHDLLPVAESDTWPSCRALVQWLVTLMPPGGSVLSGLPRPDTEDVLNRFFASPQGLPFTGGHRELLRLCIEDGTGDPVRWSEGRLQQLLSAAVDDVVSADVQLDLPDLLRAYVPFAHAEAGIRQELTAEALAAIDDVADHYRAAVLEDEGGPASV